MSARRKPFRTDAEAIDRDIYDGRIRLGSMKSAAGGHVLATLADGKRLGRFPNAKAAHAAIMAAIGASRGTGETAESLESRTA